MPLEAYFVRSQPAMGRETNEPIGKPINTVPNSASESCRVLLKSGIRVAHVAKFNPHIKNKIPILKRDFFINLTIIFLRPSNYSHVENRLCVGCEEPYIIGEYR